MHNKHILLLSDRSADTCTFNLAGELRRHFSAAGMNVIEVTAHTLTNPRYLANAHCVVLPGIVGEECFYREQIGDLGFERLKRYVHGGGQLMGFCAGSYVLFDKSVYTPEVGKGSPREKSSLVALIPGEARGPIPSSALKRQDLPATYCTLTRISTPDTLFGNAVGSETPERIFHLCYAGGPAYHIPENVPHTVLARFTDVAGKPPAIVEYPYGEGKIIASAVHPEFGSSMAEVEALSARGTEHRQLMELKADLLPYEDERRFFMTQLFDRFKNAEANTVSHPTKDAEFPLTAPAHI
ncbi:MAG: BPL-N domain-containing protein [Pseudobdellovibrionaceae bacterium]